MRKLSQPSRAMGMRPLLPSASRRPAPLDRGLALVSDEVNWWTILWATPPTPPYREAKARPPAVTTTMATASTTAPTMCAGGRRGAMAPGTSAATTWATTATAIAPSAERPRCVPGRCAARRSSWR